MRLQSVGYPTAIDIPAHNSEGEYWRLVFTAPAGHGLRLADMSASDEAYDTLFISLNSGFRGYVHGAMSPSTYNLDGVTVEGSNVFYLSGPGSRGYSNFSGVLEIETGPGTGEWVPLTTAFGAIEFDTAGPAFVEASDYDDGEAPAPCFWTDLTSNVVQVCADAPPPAPDGCFDMRPFLVDSSTGDWLPLPITGYVEPENVFYVFAMEDYERHPYIETQISGRVTASPWPGAMELVYFSSEDYLEYSVPISETGEFEVAYPATPWGVDFMIRPVNTQPPSSITYGLELDVLCNTVATASRDFVFSESTFAPDGELRDAYTRILAPAPGADEVYDALVSPDAYNLYGNNFRLFALPKGTDWTRMSLATIIGAAVRQHPVTNPVANVFENNGDSTQFGISAPTFAMSFEEYEEHLWIMTAVISQDDANNFPVGPVFNIAGELRQWS